MKLTTAVLAAGAAVSLTTAVVGATRLRQNARHQAERNEAFLTRNQLDWLAQMSTNPDLAKLWAPEDMDVEEYMQLLAANRLICILSVRDRLGFVRTGHLPWHAAKLMENDACRRYWQRFGDLRAEEAEGDEQGEHFTRVLDQAAKQHPRAQAAAT
ncbi:DUF6082 family protein [Streptomyces sp. CT1-17]|uniref:DUF6082 family protein n=1 Tax=unclassified Streptomyces TaxID=2593676 RepID=UPI001413B7E9|nr:MULTISPECIES: DUF6082 family protein [unclassified Streptomyces]MCC2269971.1 DUF6082 family protein [Streptomyces sp. CT1-17]QIP73617.1 peptide transporter permease SapC [Streptomyces sp. VN1]